jgi:hypothetical protein
METTLYNQHGKPVAYIAEDGKTVYGWDGRALAYIWKDKVFGWNGRQLGWYDNGTIFDIFGMRSGFIRKKSPIPTQTEPLKPVKGMKPVKSRRQEAVSKPGLIYGYSVKTLEELLEDGAAR